LKAQLAERAVAGLHDAVVGEIRRILPKPGTCVDLGAGSGALSQRLSRIGWNVLAVEKDRDSFAGDAELAIVDLEQEAMPPELFGRKFDLVVSTEVIEHMESPIRFLRLVAELMDNGSVAVVTTPNVDSALARMKFLVRDRLRMMDEAGDPTHISPIFWDLVERQYLPRAGLEVLEHSTFPRRGFASSRPLSAAFGRLAALVLPGDCNFGDSHILVLSRPRKENLEDPRDG
jgi:SAM-dependent methyltransferase